MIDSLQTGLDAFFAFVPQLIGAIVILIGGYVVAKILQAVVARVLKAVGFDGWMEKGGIKQLTKRTLALSERRTEQTISSQGEMKDDKSSYRLLNNGAE